MEHAINAAENAESKKTPAGLASLACSLIGILLSFIIKRPFVDVIHIGFIFAFLGMILSMAAVKNTGRNALAMLAFWVGFAALWISAGLGASYV